MYWRRTGSRGDEPASAPPSRHRRWRIHRSGWWIPLLAGPVVAIAGVAPAGPPSSRASGAEESRPRNEETREGVQTTTEGQEASEGGDSTRAVPLGHVDLDVDLPVASEADRVSAADDELHRQGLIGAGDTLAPAGSARRLGNLAVIRANQEHRGLPVFAAQVVVTAEGPRIVKIAGHTAPDIDLETTTPANDYPATATLAERRLGHAVTTEDEGTLVIFPVDGGYRLAWLGMVVIDNGREEAAFDAETGLVLHRVPTSVRASGGAMSGPQRSR